MKKIYIKPITKSFQMYPTQMIMFSENRGWTIDGTFDGTDGYQQNMGADDHDVTFNLWQQEDDGWVDID